MTEDGLPIPNATLSESLKDSDFHHEIFHEYRFDCHPDRGAEYFIDGDLVYASDHNIPEQGGTLQFKLWADGNKWWSGTPSTTDVFMTMERITAYYNTSTPDPKWSEACQAAGGPSSETICNIK